GRWRWGCGRGRGRACRGRACGWRSSRSKWPPPPSRPPSPPPPARPPPAPAAPRCRRRTVGTASRPRRRPPPSPPGCRTAPPTPAPAAPTAVPERRARAGRLQRGPAACGVSHLLAEAVVQQRHGIGERHRIRQDHADQGPVAPPRAANDAVAGVVRLPGLEPDCAWIAPEQAVEVLGVEGLVVRRRRYRLVLAADDCGQPRMRLATS